MQQIENDEKQTFPLARLRSQPLQNSSLTQDDESDDPEQIFMRAVAEIDTQPLPKQARGLSLADVLEIMFLGSVLCMSLAGVIWQCLTYPHTLVILSAREYPASITATF